MGEVYEAVQESLNRSVALKVLPPHLAADVEFVKRFNRESGALAQLSHPYIVRIFDRGRDGELYYFVLEYIEGKSGDPTTLQHLLRSKTHFTVPFLAGLLRQIAEALAYVHSKGVIHRDVKPSNVLLDQWDNARLADFGIAQVLGLAAADRLHLTMPGTVLGSLAYLAPEQRNGNVGVDARADIYSCGVMCYQMLTGQMPEGAFEPPSQLVSGVSAAWDVMIERALQRNPDRRFPNMEEFLAALQQIMSHGSEQMHLVGNSEGSESSQVMSQTLQAAALRELDTVKDECCRFLEEGRPDQAILRLELALAKFPRDHELQALSARAEKMRAEAKSQLETELACLKAESCELIQKGQFGQAKLRLELGRKKFKGDAELEALTMWGEEEAKKSAKLEVQLEVQRSQLKIEARQLIESGKLDEALLQLRIGRTKFKDDSEIHALYSRVEEDRRSQQLREDAERENLKKEVRRLLEKGDYDYALLQLEVGQKTFSADVELNTLSARAQDERKKAKAKVDVELARLKNTGCRMVECAQYEQAIAYLKLALGRFPCDVELEALLTWAEQEERKSSTRMESERNRLMKEAQSLLEKGDPRSAVGQMSAGLARFKDDIEFQALLCLAEKESQKQKDRLHAKLTHLKQVVIELLEGGNYERAIVELDAGGKLFADDVDLQSLRSRAEQEQKRIRDQVQADLARFKGEVCGMLETGNYDQALAHLRAGESKSVGDLELQALRSWAEREKQKAVSQAQAEQKLITGEARCLLAEGDLDGALARLKVGLARFGNDTEIQSLHNQAEAEQAKHKEQTEARIALLVKTAKHLLDQGDYDQAISILGKESKEFAGNSEIRDLHARSEEQRNRIKAEFDAQLAHLNEVASRLLKADKHEQAIALLEPLRGRFGADPAYKELCARAEDQQRQLRAIITDDIPRLWNECRIGAMLDILSRLTIAHPDTKGLGEATQQAQDVIAEAEALVAEGTEWMSRHKYKKAIPYFEQAGKISIDYEPALFGLREARAGLKRTARRRSALLICIVLALSAAAAVVVWNM